MPYDRQFRSADTALVAAVEAHPIDRDDSLALDPLTLATLDALGATAALYDFGPEHRPDLIVIYVFSTNSSPPIFFVYAWIMRQLFRMMGRGRVGGYGILPTI